MSDIKQNTTLKGKLESRQGPLAPGSRSTIPVTAFYASWTTFKFTIKKQKENVQYFAPAASLGPLKTRGRISGLRLGGGKELSLVHVFRGCHSLSTMFQSWNSECKSLADEMAGKQKLPCTQKASKVLL